MAQPAAHNSVSAGSTPAAPTKADLLRADICFQLQTHMWRRMREGLTAEIIAGRLGKSVSYVWEMIGGMRKFELPQAADLAWAMDLRTSVQITPNEELAAGPAP